MKCPKCGAALAAKDRTDVAGCPGCGGVFVPRGKTVIAPTPGPPPQPATSPYDAAGGQCPVDHSIMSRATIELPPAGTSFHLERCPSCHGVWFDDGEWNALASAHLAERLDEFWTAEWRTRQRREHDQREYETRVNDAFGPELHQQLIALAQVLRHHPRRSQALAFLREESSE
jgi:Zn-finger nucleic acid-binding protein